MPSLQSQSPSVISKARKVPSKTPGPARLDSTDEDTAAERWAMRQHVVDALTQTDDRPHKLMGIYVNDDTYGYMLNGAARNCISMGRLFLQTALVMYASTQAGCYEEDDDDWVYEEHSMTNITLADDDADEPCQKRIYGLYPASLVSTCSSLSGFITAFIMPIVGSIVDHSPYRKEVAVTAVIVLLVTNAMQVRARAFPPPPSRRVSR